MIEPEPGDFGMFYCRSNGNLHSPPGYSRLKNGDVKNSAKRNGNRAVSLLDGDLFQQCLYYISRNVDLLDSLDGLPDYYGNTLFLHMVKDGCFEDTIAAPKLLKLFNEAYPDQLMIHLSCKNCRFVLENKTLELQAFKTLVKLNLSDNDVGEHDPLIATCWTIPSLEILVLQNIKLTDQGLEKYTMPYRMLKKGPKNLKYLDLSRNSSLSSGALKYLVAFKELMTIDLSYTAVCDNSLMFKFKNQTSMELERVSHSNHDCNFQTEGWATDLIQLWMSSVKNDKDLPKTKQKTSSFYGIGRKLEQLNKVAGSRKRSRAALETCGILLLNKATVNSDDNSTPSRLAGARLPRNVCQSIKDSHFAMQHNTVDLDMDSEDEDMMLSYCLPNPSKRTTLTLNSLKSIW